MNDINLLNLYIRIFINCFGRYSEQYVDRNGGFQYAHREPEKQNQYFPYQPVSPALIQKHLAGEITCAWAAISTTGTSKWLCFDCDTDNGELNKLEEFLRKHNWRPIREGRRPGREGHLWLLFNEPVRAEKLIILGNTMMRHAYVEGIELFPKSAKTYSQVRGPLGINLKPEANRVRGWFDGPPQDVQSQLRWLADQPLNRAVDANFQADRHTPPAQEIKTFKKPRVRSKSRCINILEYVSARRMRGAYVAQCPLCAAEGHDRHRDNLRINSDGSKFCCVYHGPSQIHKNKDIVKALLGNS